MTPVRERGDRDARGGAGMREARDRLELADEEPRPGGVEVVRARRREDRLVRAGERRRPRGGGRHGEVDAVAVGGDTIGRPPKASRARAGGGSEAGGEPSCRHGCPAACRRERICVVRRRGELGVEERPVEGVERLPRRDRARRRRAARSGSGDERDDGESEERSAPHPRCSASRSSPHPPARLRPAARLRGLLRPARSAPRSHWRASGPGFRAGRPAWA